MPAPGSVPKPKILIVDDDPENLNLLEAQLIEEGYQVLRAMSGESAIGMTSAGNVDLIIMDVLMPEMDGFEVARRLRNAEVTRLLPIVLVTALEGKEDRLRGIEAGADDFITRPYDKAEIQARIRALLRLSYYRRLLDEKEKFEYLLDQAGAGICVLDGSLRVTRTNRIASELLETETGADFLTHVRARFLPAYPGDLASDIRSSPIRFELERPETEALRPLILEVGSRPVNDPLGEISSVILTLKDVTEARRTEFAENDFLTLLSHKIAAPLTLIRGQAELLRDRAEAGNPADSRAAMGVVLEKADELARVFDKLLGYAMLKTRRPDLKPETLLLETELRRIAVPFARSGAGRPVVLHVHARPRDASIWLERSHLEMMLRNLLENAVKFNDKPKIRIRILARAVKSGVEILVADNGPGIPPEERGKIFERFYQMDKHRTGNVGGAGLGLAIVKHLAAFAGGRAEVASTLGRGSVFVVSLPSPASSSKLPFGKKSRSAPSRGVPPAGKPKTPSSTRSSQ